MSSLWSGDARGKKRTLPAGPLSPRHWQGERPLPPPHQPVPGHVQTPAMIVTVLSFRLSVHCSEHFYKLCFSLVDNNGEIKEMIQISDTFGRGIRAL